MSFILSWKVLISEESAIQQYPKPVIHKCVYYSACLNEINRKELDEKALFLILCGVNWNTSL